MKIGSHCGNERQGDVLGSVKEALSYGADTLMVYTGAPQNTRRKAIEELRVEEGWNLMKREGNGLRLSSMHRILSIWPIQ